MMESKIAAGTKVYDVSHKAVSAVGFVMGSSEAEQALRTRVAERLRDPEGAAIIAAALEGLEEAEFDRHRLESVLTVELPDDPWRIGEALAECYLEDHNECLFPWPAQRDLRNPKASPAGADLAGFRGQGEKARFAFGEVKTSEDASAPPNVMYGRSGMVK
jgi:hypothetical protein